MEGSGPALGFVYDTGHLAFSPGPTRWRMLDKWGDRVTHVHVQGMVRPGRFWTGCGARILFLSFDGGRERRLFGCRSSDPEGSCLDFPGHQPTDAGGDRYAGWIVVEAEQ